jgi:hypothetical protein
MQTGKDNHKITQNAPTPAWPRGYHPDPAGRVT